MASGLGCSPQGSSSSALWNQEGQRFSWPPNSPEQPLEVSASWADAGVLPSTSVRGVLILEDDSEHLLYLGENSIGRSPNSVIRMYDSDCASNHCLIFCVDNQEVSYTLECLGATQGTYLNGHRVSAFHAHPLQSMDKIVLGKVRAQFFALDDYLKSAT